MRALLLIVGSLLLGSPAAAQTEFNVNGQALNFAGAGTGSGTTVNSTRTYSNIITIGGQQINARITLTEMVNATMSAFDSTANPYAETNFFQPNLTVSTVNGYATFRIDFLDTSNNPVLLRNLYLNTYDLDGSGAAAAGRQFTDFQGFDSYNLSTTTQVSVRTVGAFTRFVTTVGGNRTDAIGSSAFNDIRARVFFSTPTTSVTFRVGDEGATGLAYYAIDPTVGYTFGNAAASLSTTKTLASVNGSAYVAGTPIKSGDVLTYRLDVQETGLAAGGTTTLTETVPALTTYSGTAEGWAVAAGNYTQSVTVAAGATVSNTFTVTVGTLADNNTSIVNTVTSSNGTCAVCTTTTSTVPRLRIAKTPPVSLPAGGSASYSIALTNAGGSATSGTVTFTDTLPAGLTFSSQTAGSPSLVCGAAGQTVTCTGTPAIAAGGSLNVAYGVTIAANATGTLVNSVLLTARGGDVRTPADDAATPTAGNSTQGSDGLSAKAAQAVSTPVTAVTESGTVVAGSASTAIANVRSNDLVNGVAATGANSTIATSGSWPSGITLNTTTGAISVSGAVAPGTYSVTYQLCDLATPTPNCTTVADSVTVQAADLTIAMTHTGSFIPGGSGSFGLTVTNAGDAATAGTVTVTNTVPSGLTPTTASGTGWTCNVVAQALTCTRADALGIGGSYPAITLNVNVDNNAPVSITNTAVVAGGGEVNTTNNSASDTVTVGTVADLTVAMTHTGAFTPNGTGTFAITATNAGAGATTGTVTVTDTLPAGLTPTTATGSGWSCTVAGQVVTCTRSDALAASGNYPAISVDVTVAGNAAGSITNTATVSGGGEVNTTNNSANDAVTIGTTADLTLAMTHPGTFTPGGTGSFSLVATNSGAGATTGTVTVTNTLPAGLTPTTATGTGWTCTVAGQTVTCTRSDALAASGAYPPISVNVTVAGNAAGSITNTATVSGGGEINTANNSASDTITVGSSPDLTVTMSHPGTFTLGGIGSFSITASNSGGGPTIGAVTVTNTLPAGLTPTTATGTGWTCSVAGQTVTCTRNDVLAASGSYPSITLGVSIAANAPASITNTVTVAGGGEVNTSNNSASDPVTLVIVSGGPDLALAKSHSGTIVRGGTATYSLVVSNNGTGPTTAVVTVVDTLPVGLSPLAASGNGWSCAIAAQVVTCSRADALATQASYPAIALVARVAPSIGASVTNTAAVSTSGETNGANNGAIDPTLIEAGADLVLAKSHAGNFRRGETNVFTLTASNSGGSPTSGAVTVTDVMPAGLAAVAAEGDGWTCQVEAARVSCGRADALASGAAYPPVRLTVKTALDAADSLINRAEVGGGNEVDSRNDSASDTVVVVGIPDLVIRLTHLGELELFQNGEYELVVSNIGDIRTAAPVVVNDELPAGLTPTAAIGTGWSCQLLSRKVTCTRSDALEPGASYPTIRLTVAIGAETADLVVNSATVATEAREASTSNNAAEDTAVLKLPPPVELVLTKAADRAAAEIGDVVTYRVTVTNPSERVAVDAGLRDLLPDGFHYVAGTAQVTATGSDARSIEPAVEGATLVFPLGVMAPGRSVEVRYRARIGADARPGEATNTASGATTFRGRTTIGSRSARAAVTVTRGILSMRQFLTGRVYEDVNDNGRFDAGDRPMPEARIYVVNGQSVTTDSAGMYSVPSLDEGALVLTLDPVSLPPDYTLSSANHRSGESWSRLLRTPLGGGALLTQDFPLRRLVSATAAPEGTAPSSSVTDAMPAGASVDQLVVVPGSASLAAGGRTSTLIRIVVPEAQRGTATSVRVRTSLGRLVVPECGQDQATTQPCAGDVPTGNRPGQDDTDKRTRVGNAPVGAAGNGDTGLGTERLGFDRSVEAFTQAIVPVINGEASVRLISDHVPGVAHIAVEAGSIDEPTGGEAEVVFTPELRTPLFVSHGEVAIGRAAPEFGLFGQAGDIHQRGALFFQRNFFGDGALTVAYSSQRSLNEGTGVRRMFQLDPLDRVYPVFGDSSTRYEAAQANSKVYVRVDQGRSYFLFGDLRADSTRSADPVRLTEFARNLTGARLHLESPKGRAFEVTAARPDTAFARDVFPGDTAGIIRLSNAFVLPGSETVVVEVRDRRNPDLVLSRETLVRSVDYSLDWTTGGVLLLRSLGAMDRSLNLVQLVLTYEHQVAGLTSNVVSLRGATDVPGVGLRVGASMLRQREGTTDPYFLQGLQARLALPQEGHLQVDLPVSHGSLPVAGPNGGTATTAGETGAALRLELEQPISVLKGVFTASAARTDRAFFNPFGVTTLPGSQNVRGALSLRPRTRSRIVFGIGDERNRTDAVDNQRLTTSVEWTEELRHSVAIGLGYSHRDLEDRVRVLDISSNLLQASVTWQPTSRASVLVRREQNLGTADLTYPTQTVVNGRYRLSDHARLFFTQRVGSAPIVPLGDTRASGFAALTTRSETSIGLESTFRRATSLATRYQVENGINGTDSFALLGLMNRLPVRKDLSVDFGVERGVHLTGTGTSFNSASSGLGWTPGNRLRATTRYELRDRQGFGSILSAGLAGRLVDGLTAISSLQLSRASYTGRQSRATQAMAGVAMRPRGSDRTGMLFSYTLRRSDLPTWERYPGQFERIGLASMDGYVRPYGPIELFGKFALSQRESGEVEGQLVSTSTYLSQGRVQARFARYLDAAFEGRYVNQPVTRTRGTSAGAELGAWLIPDLRVGVGYNFRGNDAIGLNFLTQPVSRGVYLVVSAKLSTMFDLFGTAPAQRPAAPTTAR